MQKDEFEDKIRDEILEILKELKIRISPHDYLATLRELYDVMKEEKND